MATSTPPPSTALFTVSFTRFIRYVGGFEHFKRHGLGTFTTANGDKCAPKQSLLRILLMRVLRYVGEWKNDKHNGQGTFTYDNGDLYVLAYSPS